MVRYGQDDDAKQQISLGFAESRIGEAPPVTAENLIEAANLLLAMHDFDLATQLLREGASRPEPQTKWSPSAWPTPIWRRARRKQADAAAGVAGRRSREPIRTTTTCWRRARSTASATRSWNALSLLAQANHMGGGSDIARDGRAAGGRR